eukprot:TRINITY_DN5148_c0_g1_i6.p1 TRINITY_DN5148_c0_g1~~TRINITY_DN5148_c0_g1_i6.p1  ORF type:complete len:257 (-),score=36.71 TRINITY_DN5148_c0_g1_i6:2180-2950(-)
MRAMRGLPDRRDIIAGEARMEFTVQGFSRSGESQTHVLVLDSGFITHLDAITRSQFSQHAYADVDSLQMDTSDPLSFRLNYQNDVPYHFSVFNRDRSKIAALLPGRISLYKHVLPHGIDRTAYGDFEVPAESASSGFQSLNVSLEDADSLLRMLQSGTVLIKHTKDGRGKPHERFFKVSSDGTSVQWGPVDSKPTDSGVILRVTPGASSRVEKFALPRSFRLLVRCKQGERELDLAALSDVDYRAWTQSVVYLLSP